MKRFPLFPAALFTLVLALLLAACSEEPDEAATSESGLPYNLVEVTSETIPGIVIELPYATTDNSFERQFYPENRCYLLQPTAEKLAKVQAELQAQGMGIKIWDGYRPLEVQRQLWKVMPDPQYVADPAKGSRHNRGCAVDITLVDSQGQELEMPTGYDDFSPAASATYLKVSETAANNRKLLFQVMHKHGFRVLDSEWWHFDSDGWEEHPVLDVQMDELYVLE